MRANQSVIGRLIWLLVFAILLNVFGGLTVDVAADGIGDPPPPSRDPGDTIGDTSGTQNSLPDAGEQYEELTWWETAYLGITAIL